MWAVDPAVRVALPLTAMQAGGAQVAFTGLGSETPLVVAQPNGAKLRVPAAEAVVMHAQAAAKRMCRGGPWWWWFRGVAWGDTLSPDDAWQVGQSWVLVSGEDWWTGGGVQLVLWGGLLDASHTAPTGAKAGQAPPHGWDRVPLPQAWWLNAPALTGPGTGRPYTVHLELAPLGPRSPAPTYFAWP